MKVTIPESDIRKNQYNVRLHLIMTGVSRIMASDDKKSLVAGGKGIEEAK